MKTRYKRSNRMNRHHAAMRGQFASSYAARMTSRASTYGLKGRVKVSEWQEMFDVSILVLVDSLLQPRNFLPLFTFKVCSVPYLKLTIFFCPPIYQNPGFTKSASAAVCFESGRFKEALMIPEVKYPCDNLSLLGHSRRLSQGIKNALFMLLCRSHTSPKAGDHGGLFVPLVRPVASHL